MDDDFLTAPPELHVPCIGDRAAIMSLVHKLYFAFQKGFLNEEDWLDYFHQFKTYQSLCKKIDHLYKLYEEIPWYRFIGKLRMKRRLTHAENSEEKEFLYIRHLGILMQDNIRIKNE